jgi:hypothetical protein
MDSDMNDIFGNGRFGAGQSIDIFKQYSNGKRSSPIPISNNYSSSQRCDSCYSNSSDNYMPPPHITSAKMTSKQ